MTATVPVSDELLADSESMREHIERELALMTVMPTIVAESEALCPTTPLLRRAYVRGASAAMRARPLLSNPYRRFGFRVAWHYGWSRWWREGHGR